MKKMKKGLQRVFVGLCILTCVHVAAEEEILVPDFLRTSVVKAMQSLAMLEGNASVVELQAVPVHCVCVAQGTKSLYFLRNSIIDATAASVMLHCATCAVSRIINGNNPNESTSIAALQGAKTLTEALVEVASSGPLSEEAQASSVQMCLVLAEIVARAVMIQGVSTGACAAVMDLVDALCGVLSTLAGNNMNDKALFNRLMTVINNFVASLDVLANNSTDSAVLSCIEQKKKSLLVSVQAAAVNHVVTNG